MTSQRNGDIVGDTSSQARRALSEVGEHLPENRTCFAFKGLVESRDPFRASSLARDNLYNLVTEEGPDFLFGLVESPRGVWGWVDGSVSDRAILDVEYVFGPIATVTATD
ncbi:MAG: hypothetical protein LBK72_08530, partial [Bifidobacteriaceae bacterium]|nr:hypothetical protein [Bifidobacteriaceae bacterium]